MEDDDEDEGEDKTGVVEPYGARREERWRATIVPSHAREGDLA